MSDAEDARLFLADRLSARDAEMEQLATAIHGDVMQVISAVALGLGLLRDSLAGSADDDATAQLDAAERAVTDALGRLRALTAALRTHAAADGVGPGLRLRLEQLRAETGIEYELDDRLGDEPAPSLAAALAPALSEAVENIRRHSGATRVEAALAHKGAGVWCRLADDGVGLPEDDERRVDAGQMGLTLIRERIEAAGGRVEIDSAPGRGVSIELWVPEHE